MAVLWLRFLTEINSSTEQVPEELTENPEISKALEELKVTAFSEEELRAYDKFWDSVRVEKTLQHDSYKKGQDDENFAIAQKMPPTQDTNRQMLLDHMALTLYRPTILPTLL